jgi:hypothetical protein
VTTKGITKKRRAKWRSLAAILNERTPIKSKTTKPEKVMSKLEAEDQNKLTLAYKLTSMPTYPKTKLWKCIKQSATSNSLFITTLFDK